MISGGALLLALLAQSATGASPAAAARARLEVRADDDCPSRSDLATRVAARSARIQFADDAAIYARVTVTSARPGNVVAEVVLGSAGAEPSPRRVVARSCAEAADAIALIIAVTLDPSLRRRSPDSNGAEAGAAPARTSPETTGGASSTEPAAGTTSPAGAKTEEQMTPPPPAPPATVEAAVAPAPVPAVPSRRQFGAYLAGQTIMGPAPSVMPGVALYAMAGLDRPGVWAPALFVGATHVWRSGLAQEGGSASFTLDAASVDACPLRLGGARLAVRPCASGLVGRLASEGDTARNAASAARPLAIAGAAVAAGIAVGASLEISVRVGLGVTLIRDAYEIDANTFHRADRITTAASVGIGARWP